MRNGDYLLADSLLSVSISNNPHSANLFNRAIARINLKDTVGFCSDLKAGYSGYNDKEALSLYQNYCVENVDSVLYDKKFSPSEDKVRYLELTYHDNYLNRIWGEFWDLKKNYEVTRLSLNSGIQDYSTNVIATYDIFNNTKVYAKVQTPAICELSNMLQVLESNIKYSDELVEALNKATKPRVTVYVGAIVNSDGNIESPQLIKANQKVDQLVINEALRVVLLDGFKFEAATFKGETVASKTVIQVNFKKK